MSSRPRERLDGFAQLEHSSSVTLATCVEQPLKQPHRVFQSVAVLWEAHGIAEHIRSSVLRVLDLESKLVSCIQHRVPCMMA